MSESEQDRLRQLELDLEGIYREMQVDARTGFVKEYYEAFGLIQEVRGMSRAIEGLKQSEPHIYDFALSYCTTACNHIKRLWSTQLSNCTVDTDPKVIGEFIELMRGVIMMCSPVMAFASRPAKSEADAFIAKQLANNLKRELAKAGKSEGWFEKQGPLNNRLLSREWLEGTRKFSIQAVTAVARSLGIDPERLYLGIDPKQLDFARIV